MKDYLARLVTQGIKNEIYHSFYGKYLSKISNLKCSYGIFKLILEIYLEFVFYYLDFQNEIIFSPL